MGAVSDIGPGIHVATGLAYEEGETVATMGMALLSIDPEGIAWLNEQAPGWQEHVRFQGLSTAARLDPAAASDGEYIDRLHVDLAEQLAGYIVDTLAINRENQR